MGNSAIIETLQLPIANIETETDLIKRQTWSLGYTIKILCIIDFITVLFYLFYAPLILIKILLIYLGYYGASRYNSLCIIGYIIYQLLSIIGYSILLYYFHTSYQISVSILSIMVNLWITWILYKFIYNLKKLNGNAILDLKSGYRPIIITRTWI